MRLIGAPGYKLLASTFPIEVEKRLHRGTDGLQTARHVVLRNASGQALTMSSLKPALKPEVIEVHPIERKATRWMRASPSSASRSRRSPGCWSATGSP